VENGRGQPKPYTVKKKMETVNGMLKCPCCGAFIANSWEEKDALRRRLNREYAQMRRDSTRQRKFGAKKYK
jgi:hypothetical protein